MNPDIALTCHTCGEGYGGPNTGMGRALALAWLTNHQGHEVTKDQEVKS